MKLVGLPALAVALALVAALACARPSEGPPASAGDPAAADVGGAHATSSVLPFIENDHAAALDRAREAKLPLFVEVWAPW